LENEVQAAFWVVFAGKRNYANWSNTPLSQMALLSGVDEFLQNGHGGLAVSYFLFMWMIGPFMSSVKSKGCYADKLEEDC